MSVLYGTGNNDNLDGTSSDDFFFGLDGDDILTALAGNDSLNGGAGADTMVGGLGDDYYIVDDAGDTVIELLNEGTDTVYSNAISISLVDNVEILYLGGTDNLNGTGNDLDNIISANSGQNMLNGGNGNDTLNGAAGDDTLYGGNGQDYLVGGLGADVLYGEKGDDIYDVDDINDVVIENVGEGYDRVHSLIDYTLTANVENLLLLGSANLKGTGNALNNSIEGNSGDNILSGGDGNDSLRGWDGNDTLIGGAGNDVMRGDAGDDLYEIDSLQDTVIENAGQGNDTIQTSNLNFMLGANIENLLFLGSADLRGLGNELDNVLTGNDGNNILEGREGNDTLYGGFGNDTLNGGIGDDTLYGQDGNDYMYGYTGADTMYGGVGNDTYIVDDAGDTAIEYAGEGTDSVQAGISFALGAYVENLTLTGSADLDGTGNDIANNIYGNNGVNVLDGGDGNDYLYGYDGNDTLIGGAGADVMRGGLGDDTYQVDNLYDSIIESAGQGIDTVESSITYYLAGNVENLTLTGTADINGTGNNLDNLLTGNDGDNRLNGGTGADTMAGGLGNDTYIVDNAGDLIIENSGEGTDIISSYVTYTLSANVETLYLSNSSGNINGYGNTLDNTLVGNSSNNILDASAGGNNTLNGGAGNDTLIGGAGNDYLYGGTGNDTMTGGAGDDIYHVDSASDSVTENASGGFDWVQSSINYTLGNNVERLLLLGSSNLNGTGNALDNFLEGNAGNNTLDGGNGADSLNGRGGNDSLNGGAGNDTLDGGLGTNTLQGGSGNDEYHYSGGDDTMIDSTNNGNEIYDFTEYLNDYMLAYQNGDPLPVVGSIFIDDNRGNDLLVLHQYDSQTPYLDMMSFHESGTDLVISFDLPGSANSLDIVIDDYFFKLWTWKFAGVGAMESIVISGSSYIPEGFEDYAQGSDIVLDFNDVQSLIT